MKSKRALALLAGATLGATGAIPKVAGAQTVAPAQVVTPAQKVAEALTVAPAQGLKRNFITVRNVPPSLMAWWLDPTHQTTPIQIKNARQNAKLFPALAAPTGLPLGVNVPPLPTGIDRIVAIAPQNFLLVFGTEAGFAELQKTVEALDKPLRQIEVEAQFVQISKADLATLPIDFGAAQPGQPDVGLLHRNTLTILGALIARNKAKVITAPRVTAINALPASLQSTTLTPIVMAYKDEAGKMHELFDPIQEKQKVLFLSTAMGLGVVPTLNADETMTLLIAPWKPVQLNDANQKLLLDLSSPELSRTLSNVRDGETMVFKGLDSRLFPRRDKDGAPANVIVLVTARIVRRAEDDEVKTVALQR